PERHLGRDHPPVRAGQDPGALCARAPAAEVPSGLRDLPNPRYLSVSGDGGGWVRLPGRTTALGGVPTRCYAAQRTLIPGLGSRLRFSRSRPVVLAGLPW